jgi:hypothetical protein
MNTKVLPRQKFTKVGNGTRHDVVSAASQQDKQDPEYTNIEATAHTGEPSRSFKMSFQYEEAARYRSQNLHEQAHLARLEREARLAQRMRRGTESGARRARRTLAGLLLG